MPAGRPTEYLPEYCQTAIDIMGAGYSKTALAGHIGVCRQTIMAWAAAHPEFSNAVNRGMAGRVYKLEKDLLDAPSGPVVTSRIFALKNADPDEWSDKPGGETAAVVNVYVNKLADG